MYSFFHALLSDKKGGEIFTLFGFWHFLYIALTLAAVIIAVFYLKGKSAAAKMKTVNVFLNIAFGLYILDFFLMPLAYNEIDIEKLPFHACTAMCVMCFLCDHVRFLAKYRTSFVILGFISNFVYLVYPAGVMWHGVHPFSYRVIQTLLFHSVMTAYGFLAFLFSNDKVSNKKCVQDLTVVVGMTLWALLGNYIYNGTSEGYSHFFNWFFVVYDPFYVLPETVAPFIMPFLNVAVFLAAEVIVRLIFAFVKRQKKCD